MYNHQLDTFLKVAELGSFSKAAESLYISTPSVIGQINLLESTCGVKLFLRSHHGATLTAAGRSLCDDAKVIIRLSQEAVGRAQSAADISEHTVRIGTSLLFKCRMLTDIWPQISETEPNLRIEVVPIAEHGSSDSLFSTDMLGKRYDLFEGIFADISMAERCRFMELTRTPIVCAVSKSHRLADAKRLTLNDLNGEYLVMPIQGVSKVIDAFRADLLNRFPTIQIIDSPYYGVDTFTMCEMNQYILITQPVYTDIHANLRVIPLKPIVTLPYGLMYSNEPSSATHRFLEAVKKINKASK